MNSTIEQIIYSPKVYLIKFKSDKQITSTVGLTIDSLVSIDNVNITIDNATMYRGIRILKHTNKYQS
jgi:hypothetical protein